jgi:hypothetical protein
MGLNDREEDQMNVKNLYAEKNNGDIPYLTLTLGQQGGIGFPPSIVKLDRWYAVSDSRGNRPIERLQNLLVYQRMYPKKDRHWHSQEWVMKKWMNAPRLTWDEIAEKAGVSDG